MTQGTNHRVRVLLVEDSPTYRVLLSGLLGDDSRLEVIGVVGDGAQAVESAQRLSPDVIVMDIHLPAMGGFAATRLIMETAPTRIVMVTATSIPNEVAQSFEALESGALTVLAKPPGPGHPEFEAMRRELVNTVALMAEVPVVRRWPAQKTPAAAPVPVALHVGRIDLIAVGASTGGPLALQALLTALPHKGMPPIVIVQHISHGFADGLVQWLSRVASYDIKVAAHDDCLHHGMACIAPDGAHLEVKADGHVVLHQGPPVNGFRPAVATLFASVAREYGPRAAGLLLTGMGRDGAQELLAMRQAGALTMAQDKGSAVINGMPGEAVRIGAAMHVLTPQDMAATLSRLARTPSSGDRS
ncbi:chemotaxis-specific protein-glutamate methyltransferase CheB [Piscinibacter terrae]|uniref:Protein-glutamate methylesterase/protein-glutamine glutaminase n=1 Tax=Piscinibacter terrae TaxID=2496871 RepID=A0A3N7HML0_9BURK|nr:chemotaxis-specific protein-glutamate methyltransferase CheB [Albitalea terrae]RQP22853.1 chemotaxis-specific protein-glutamate methyltransferase CheB [Albitalea terrae]